MIDLFATEPHFIDHLAPVWRALPGRGDFVVHRSVVEHARSLDVVPGGGDITRPVLVASWGDYKRAVKSGYTRIAYLEHGSGQSYSGDRASVDHPGYAGGRGHIGDGLYLVPNEYSAARWRAAYPRARVDVVGLVKYDSLPQREPDGKTTVAVSFHWPCGVAPETRTLFTHYRPALAGLRDAYPVVGHGHPRWDGVVRQTYQRLGIEYLPRFEDVCRRADVYVCDNSSTIFEFAATGRPVVLLNGPGYRKDIEHGGRFWGWASVGVQCERPDDLVSAVAEAIADSDAQRAERERIVDIVYPVREGAARVAAEALIDWADAQMRRAA